FQGRLIAQNLSLYGRTSWEQPIGQWNSALNSFLSQLANLLLGNRLLYFPQWIQANMGLNYQPLLTIQADSSGVAYHWHDWSQPMYKAASGDLGLIWEMIRQSESPN